MSAPMFFHYPSLFLGFIIFMVNVPMFLGEDDYRHTSCRSTFQCGSIEGVTYPFWGGDRPNYCGHPDFKLQCLDNATSKTEINSIYRVLNITQDNQTMRVSRWDVWDDLCDMRAVNTSMNTSFTEVRYASNNVNLTLFYRCPRSTITAPLLLDCQPDETFSGFHTAFSSEPDQMQTFAECRVNIQIPVLQEAVERYNFNPMTVDNVSTVEEVLRGGFEVEYNGNITDCSRCKESGGECGYDWTLFQLICFCSNGIEEKICAVTNISAVTATATATATVDNVGRKIGIGVGTGIGSIIVMVTLMYCWKRVHISTHSIMLSRKNKKAQRVVEDFQKNYGSLAPKRYNYQDIKKITDSFKNKIGQGGYGVVYKGKLDDGHFVAVKLLDKAKADGEEFVNEVASISRTSHVNVVSLLGFCFEGSKRALIYEFVANGSLEKFIYDRNDQLQTQSYLEWKTLYQITIGVARGLEYLHRGCNTRILHFDIKPHNILLDQDFTPKISDFGLAKLCPRNESIISMLGARGTAGYIAPEVFCRNFGGVSHKSDVYSYGMMVLEIVGRRKNIDVRVDHTSEIYFPHWIYHRLEVDENLGLHGITSEEDEEVTKKMIFVALWCIQTNPVDRPAMTKVVEMLEGRLELLSTPPKPYLCSPARDPVGSSSTR